MKLEYLIIFEPSGLPIYSNCFGSFCATMGFDENLFSSFLAALTSMSQIFGEGEGGVKSVELGYTNLNFNYTLPSGKIVCVGLVKSKADDLEAINQTLDNFFMRITEIIEVEYKEKKWHQITNGEIHQLQHTILNNAIIPVFPGFRDRDVCKHQNCPFDQRVPELDAETNQPLTVWEQYTKNYDKELALLQRLFGRPLLYIYRIIDIWKHNRRENKLNSIDV